MESVPGKTWPDPGNSVCRTAAYRREQTYLSKKHSKKHILLALIFMSALIDKQD